MIAAGNVKVIGLIAATATVATNAAASTVNIDTRGFNFAEIIVMTPPAAATNNTVKMSAIQVNHTDSTSSTGTALIAGTTNTTAASTQFLIGAHTDTSNPAMTQIGIDLRGRARYLYLTVTGGDIAAATNKLTIAAVARLSRADQSPNTNTERGTDSSGFA